MQVDSSSASPTARLLIRVGLALFLLAGLASVWEVLALQPPDSPLHLGVLAGPIAQLVAHAFALGTVSVLLGMRWPSFASEAGDRWLAWGWLSGALLHLAAIAYSASLGMLAVQALDPRPDARVLFYVRASGHALSLVSLSALFVRMLRRG